jgi:hypothetical protein
MYLTRSRKLSQAAAFGAVIATLLICLAPALLARGAAQQSVTVELPVWPSTALLIKLGPSANCPTPFVCAVMSVLQRPGLSVWLLSRSPDQRKIGWHNLLFLPSD